MPPHHHRMLNEPEHAHNPVKTFWRLLGLLKDQRRQVVLLLPFLLVMTLGGLVWPWVLGGVIDLLKGSPAQPVAWGQIVQLLVFGLLVHGLGLLAQIHTSKSTVRLSIGSVVKMRRQLFTHLLTLPIARYDATRHGEFMSRLTNDTSLAGETLGQGILQFFGSVFTLLGTFVWMLWLSVPMTLVACATIPLTYFAGVVIVRVSRKLYRARQRALGELNAFAEEMISGQHTVAAFGREAEETELFAQLSNRLRSLALKAEAVGGVMGPVMNAINNLSFIIVAAVGGWLALHGRLSVGLILSFLLYARQFGRPINEIAGQFTRIQSAIAGAERVFKTVDEPAELDEGEAAHADFAAKPVRGEIEFRHVGFRYVEDTPVLPDFSLKIPAGKKVALVGETGSGKTTIISLLARFYDPQSGEILLDGKNLRELPKADLRKSLSIVLQDVHLFSGTVADNIAYGTPGRSRKQIVEAAKFANADRFITALPQGYDTYINQTDTALSQGQCQLLSIARAALSNPAILILDEATSSVDTLTELHIQEAMVRLLEGRTSIVIAHRLSTVRDADRIIVLDHGRIVGQGTHEELLASNAPYQRLCGVSTVSEEARLA